MLIVIVQPVRAGNFGICSLHPFPPYINEGPATHLGSYVQWVLWCATGPEIKKAWSFMAMLKYAFMAF
jgi:hypothetical protein